MTEKPLIPFWMTVLSVIWPLWLTASRSLLPTIYGRDGNRLLIHGAHAGGMLRIIGSGVRVCVTVTLVDGLVLGRSARMHSVNYHSVVILGLASEIADVAPKTLALRHIVEHAIPGSREDVRPPSAAELKGTSVLEIPINKASAKIRKGPPMQAALDSDFRVWSGVVPMRTVAFQPIADRSAIEDAAVPAHLQQFLNRWMATGRTVAPTLTPSIVVTPLAPVLESMSKQKCKL